MTTKEIMIVCRSRPSTTDVKRTSFQGILSWAGHLKNKYIFTNVSKNSNIKTIKSKIFNNLSMPEWIGNRRFGIFDLLNYIINDRKYVFEPSTADDYFDAIGFSTITSIHLQDFLIKNGYQPINIDNIDANRKNFMEIATRPLLAVVVSATYFNSAGELIKIIDTIRTQNEDVPIIIGGMALLTHLENDGHLSRDYESLISSSVYIVIDEYGLSTLAGVLQALQGKQPIENVPNIAFKNKKRVVYTQRLPDAYSFDEVFPDWRHSEILRSAKGLAFLRASKGCTFKCKFCTFPKATVKPSYRSVKSIRDELRLIRDSGIQNFAFTDDHFAVNPKRIDEICAMMIKEKFNFNWFAGIRANAINSENVGLLKASGCKVLCIGLESGSQRMLKLMNKKTHVDENMRCLKLLDEHDILAYGSFILGFPGESEASVQETINWINASPLKLYKVFMFYMLPGSIIYDEQADHSVTYFGDKYDFSLWKTPTLDALKASELLKDFILRIETASLIYSYSPMYAFFPFLLKGYTMKDALAFFKLKTELVKNELSSQPILKKRRTRNELFNRIEGRLRSNQFNLNADMVIRNTQ